MSLAAEHTELVQIEQRRLRALVDGDVPVAESIHADDFQLITPGGDVYNKDADDAGLHIDVAAGAHRADRTHVLVARKDVLLDEPEADATEPTEPLSSAARPWIVPAIG